MLTQQIFRLKQFLMENKLATDVSSQEHENDGNFDFFFSFSLFHAVN